MRDFLYVFIGGGLGSSLRYSASLLARSLDVKVWYSTLLVNIIGATAMLLLSYKFNISEDSSKLLKVGLLGGLTTFSTFSLEVVSAFKNGNTAEGISILCLNIFLGIIVGIWIFR